MNIIIFIAGIICGYILYGALLFFANKWGERMKYLIGTIFCIGMAIYSLIQHKKEGILTAVGSVFAGVLFFGQFISRM